jgi:hypothetical protein
MVKGYVWLGGTNTENEQGGLKSEACRMHCKDSYEYSTLTSLTMRTKRSRGRVVPLFPALIHYHHLFLIVSVMIIIIIIIIMESFGCLRFEGCCF